MKQKLTETEKRERKRAYDRKYYAQRPEKHRERSRQYRAELPEKARAAVRASTLKSKYGITQDDYDAMLSAQGHKCALCLSDAPRGSGSWHVDHSHETGAVRGLLCQPCNNALGLFKDNPDTLLRAVDYLKAV